MVFVGRNPLDWQIDELHYFVAYPKTTQPEIDICTFGNVEAQMRVFSRWGNLLAEDVCSWDGLVDSDESHEGVYYYIIDLKSACYGREENEQRHGHVSLVRGE